MELPLIDEKKRQKKGIKYVDSGKLIFCNVSSWRNYTFLEYIAGGTQLDFSLAVDMTSSNGHPSKETSLHHVCDSKLNDYQVAIRTVVDICQHYNSSKTFEAMAFGAKIGRGPHARVNHCFPLDIESGSFEVSGVSGIMGAYQRCVATCTLFGPTFFGPVILRATKKATIYARHGSRYLVLLIITDGCICDFETTKNAIISASSLPLSIIIIGVGDEDFTQMKELDSDDKLLSSGTRTAERDIVQFVSLREFISHVGDSGGVEVSMARLAKEVLEEIPLQLTSFMKSRQIRPRSRDDPFPQTPRVAVDDNDDEYAEIGDGYEVVRSSQLSSNVRHSAPPGTYQPHDVQLRYVNLSGTDRDAPSTAATRHTSLPPSNPLTLSQKTATPSSTATPRAQATEKVRLRSNPSRPHAASIAALPVSSPQLPQSALVCEGQSGATGTRSSTTAAVGSSASCLRNSVSGSAVLVRSNRRARNTLPADARLPDTISPNRLSEPPPPYSSI